MTDTDIQAADGGGVTGHPATPLMPDVAEKDSFVPPPAQARNRSALGGDRTITPHAFARVGGQHCDKASADRANTRAAAFFKQHLG